MDLKQNGWGVFCVSRTSKHRVEIGQNFLDVVVEVGKTVERLKARITGRSKYFFSVSGKQHITHLLADYSNLLGSGEPFVSFSPGSALALYKAQSSTAGMRK
jgi:hypothetical protein